MGAWLVNRMCEVCHMDSYNHTLDIPRSLRVYAEALAACNIWLLFYRFQ